MNYYDLIQQLKNFKFKNIENKNIQLDIDKETYQKLRDEYIS